MPLPVSIPNPAHAQFIARSSTDPINETQTLTATRARQVMALHTFGAMRRIGMA